jgi:hypothetical protein
VHEKFASWRANASAESPTARRSATGSVTNAGTAIGVNAKSITVKNSTLQGVE